MRLCACLVLLALSTTLLPGWNYTGHRAIAFLAFNYLSPRARARVDAILRAHPDFSTVLSAGTPKDPSAVTRSAFVVAATWPDIIKSDSRFSDDPAARLPLLRGFPDMGRHGNWHYINVPWPRRLGGEPVDSTDAVRELTRLLKTLHKSGKVTPEEAYALPWILHIVTDLHQPLHAITYTWLENGKVDQDRGGNGCYLTGKRNLHSLWDGALGTDMEEGAIARLSASLNDHLAKPDKVNTKPNAWVQEAVELAGKAVYNFPGDCHSKDHPLALPAGYEANARKVALDRGALGAYRLAALLNSALGN